MPIIQGVIRKPFRVERSLYHTTDATRLIREIQREFPLAGVDESDQEDVMRDFALTLDRNGRRTTNPQHGGEADHESQNRRS